MQIASMRTKPIASPMTISSRRRFLPDTADEYTTSIQLKESSVYFNGPDTLLTFAFAFMTTNKMPLGVLTRNSPEIMGDVSALVTYNVIGSLS